MYRPEIKSISGTVGTTLELDTNWELPNSYVAVKYFDADPDVAGANEVVPGAGTVTVTAKLAIHDKYVDITDGIFTSTVVNSFASFQGNVTAVKAVPAGLTIATHYKLVVSQNVQ